ncbi:MAG: hypothetical protein ACF8R7_10795 [Phycisphaerales bacterium JB039]
MQWLDKLIDFLCEILEVLDGDCSELIGDASDPEVVIDAIEEQYDPNSPPQPADNAEKGQWCGLFAATESHLDLPENSLSPAYDTKIRQMINSLQSDVGC